jgi:hypothetical protein
MEKKEIKEKVRSKEICNGCMLRACATGSPIPPEVKCCIMTQAPQPLTIPMHFPAIMHSVFGTRDASPARSTPSRARICTRTFDTLI